MKPEKKTTKQVLEEALKDQKHTPLYNPKALDELKQVFNKWQQESVQPVDRENWL